MRDVVISLLAGLASTFRTRASLQLEILALRHQLGVLQRKECRRLRLRASDRFLWVMLLRVWTDWRTAMVLVKPETVIGWHRRGFRLYWNWKSRCRIGRPSIPKEIRELIREMSTETARGTAEAWDRGVSGNGCKVHGEASEAAFANLADISGEPYQTDRIGGLLRCTDRDLSHPVRLPRPCS